MAVSDLVIFVVGLVVTGIVAAAVLIIGTQEAEDFGEASSPGTPGKPED